MLSLQCLGILNYFRSVERTLTINDQGLSLEAGRLKRTRQVYVMYMLTVSVCNKTVFASIHTMVNSVLVLIAYYYVVQPPRSQKRSV